MILIDSPWATNYNTYEFNPKQFDNAPEMVRHLHEEGYKLVLWHTSWINQETAVPGEDGFKDKIPTSSAANFAEADKNGYFLHRPDGSTYIAQWWKGRGGLDRLHQSRGEEMVAEPGGQGDRRGSGRFQG